MNNIVETLSNKMLADGKLVLDEGTNYYLGDKNIALSPEQLDDIYQVALENDMNIKMKAIMSSSDISDFEDEFIEDRSEMYIEDGEDEDDAYAQAEADADDLLGESDTYVEYFLSNIDSNYHYEYHIDEVKDECIVFSVKDSVKNLLDGESFSDNNEPLIHDEDIILTVTLYK